MKVTIGQVGAAAATVCLSVLLCIAFGNAIHRSRVAVRGPARQVETVELTPSFEVDDSEPELTGRVDVGWVTAFSPTHDGLYARIGLGPISIKNGETIAVQELRQNGKAISVRVVATWGDGWQRPSIVTLMSEVKVDDGPIEYDLVGSCEVGKTVKVPSIISRHGSRHKGYLGVRFDGFDEDRALITTSLIR